MQCRGEARARARETERSESPLICTTYDGRGPRTDSLSVHTTLACMESHRHTRAPRAHRRRAPHTAAPSDTAVHRHHQAVSRLRGLILYMYITFSSLLLLLIIIMIFLNISLFQVLDDTFLRFFSLNATDALGPFFFISPNSCSARLHSIAGMIHST